MVRCFLFVAASHRCAMPIARSAPAVVSATEIARAKRSILSSSQPDIGPPNHLHPAHVVVAARFNVMQFAYAADTGRGMLQIVSMSVV